MAQLLRYEDFIDRVDNLGFMSLLNILPGFPSHPEETIKMNWHTGDPDTARGAEKTGQQKKNI